MKRFIMSCLPILALLVLLSAGPAFAASATANITVSATVAANCTISAGNVNFGSYDPLSATDLDGSGSFTIRCTRGTNPTIELDAGGNASGGVRRMAGGSDFLSYYLFSNSGRTNQWGTIASGNAYQPFPAGVPNSGPQSVTIYGRILNGQDVPSGAYGDTVRATINF